MSKKKINQKSWRVVIAAGGTGGHIIPGLALADQLQADGVRVRWLGADRGLERRMVQGRFPLTLMRARAVRGKGVLARCMAAVNLLAALLQSVWLLLRWRPDCLVGLGGYASGPGGLAAVLLRIPLIIHEQNTVPGLTNRILRRWAKKVLLGFPEVKTHWPQAEWVGNPVPASLILLGAQRCHVPAGQGLRVLVLGGSRGAHAINEAVTAAADSLSDAPIQWWHQTGEVDEEAIRLRMARDGYQVSSFIDDMTAAYQWADCVIARAGALTVSELMAVGLPSLLIPYPWAVDDHQMSNARYLEAQGGAWVAAQAGLDSQVIVTACQSWLNDPACRVTMGEAAHSLATPQACTKMRDCCWAVMAGDGWEKEKLA